MGKEKSKWTEDEEDALLGGVRKHGPGKWKNILRDPEFAAVLSLRSNIDLKVFLFLFTFFFFSFSITKCANMVTLLWV